MLSIDIDIVTQHTSLATNKAQIKIQAILTNKLYLFGFGRCHCNDGLNLVRNGIKEFIAPHGQSGGNINAVTHFLTNVWVKKAL